MAKKGMRIGGGYYVNYGNAADYLARRVARDRPDILHEMKDGKYNSVRQAAIAAGIIKIPTAISGIAQQLGVSYRTICRWRSGQSHPGTEKKQALVKMAQQTAGRPRPSPGEEEDKHAEI